MTTWVLWDVITEEARVQLRGIQPAGWQPPKSSQQDINRNVKLEGLEEINYLMRKPPKKLVRVK